MKRPAPLLLLAPLAALLFAAGEARACSCAPPKTALDAYEWADAVVLVRPVSVEKYDPAQEEPAEPGGEKDEPGEKRLRPPHGVVSTRVLVEKVFKGGLKAGDEMTFPQGGGADCVWTFGEEDVGRQFLFYLKRLKGEEGEGDIWLAGTCSRSRPAQYAGDDLLYLNNIDKARGRTRLSGTLRFFGKDAPAAEGRPVRVSGAGQTRVVKTDKDGVYEIYDLPAGTYTVETEAPHGWSPRWQGGGGQKMTAVVAARRHAALDIHFEVDNALRGRVFDTRGEPMKGVCLNAVPARGEDKRWGYPYGCTDEGGHFEIKRVEPGGYVLVVNRLGLVSADEPFKTFYYPNVFEREKATVLTVGAGEVLEGLNVYAPATEETVTVEGVLLYSDGKPAADEIVSFEPAEKQPGVDGEAGEKTDSAGRFSFKVLKGLKGELYGEMFTYLGEHEDCPKLDELIRKSGEEAPEIRTPAVHFGAASDLRGLVLKFPFPACKKAKPPQ